MNTDTTLYFYKGSSFLSNTHQCSFSWYCGKANSKEEEFKSAEQALMYGKAKLFGDSVMAEAIMNAKDSSSFRSLGRRVQEFDNKAWVRCRSDLMKSILTAKFGQNELLCEKLV